MSKVVSINKNKPHYLSKALCLTCFAQWFVAYPNDADNTFFECPNCGKRDCFTVPLTEQEKSWKLNKKPPNDAS